MVSRYFRVVFLSVFSMCIVACGSNKNAEPSDGAGDWEGFEMTPVSGQAHTLARKINSVGDITEDGYVLDGKKNGMWLTYHPEGRIKTIENFIDGDVEGLALKFDKRGQISEKAFYANGKFNGEHTTYKFGRPLETIPYNHGEINGRVIRYYINGRMKEEIDFVNGVQHGYYNHYNADEKIDMRYEYSNGEKVSGGMVDPEK